MGQFHSDPIFLTAVGLFLLFPTAALGLEPSIKKELVQLLAAGTSSNTPSPNDMKVFKEMGCKEEWTEDNELEKTRFKKAQQLVTQNPNILSELADDWDADSLFIIGRLRLETSLENPRLPQRHEAEILISSAAKQNHPHALYIQTKKIMRDISYYDNKPGNGNDFFKINDLLETSAERGSAAAARELGRRTQDNVLEKFQRHKKLWPKEKRSVYWRKLSANLGDPEGQSAYANFGKIGSLEQKKWLEKSAMGGYHIANYDVGRGFALGTNGFPQDTEKAIYFHCRAIAYGNQWSAKALKKLHGVEEEKRPPPTIPKVNLPEDINPDGDIDSSLTQDEKVLEGKIFTWMDHWLDPSGTQLDLLVNRKCSTIMTLKARYNKFINYDSTKERKIAIRNSIEDNGQILEKMKNSSNARSWYLLGRLLEENIIAAPGQDSPYAGSGFWASLKKLVFKSKSLEDILGLNEEEAIPSYWHQKSAEQGYGPAEFMLAYKLKRDLGGTFTDWEGLVLKAAKAVEAGSANAAYQMGLFSTVAALDNDSGKSLPVSQRTEVRKWNCLAADMGHIPAAYKCGQNHYSGLGGPRDYEKARFYSNKSAEGNYSPAFQLLSTMYNQGLGVEKDEDKAHEFECKAYLYGQAARGRDIW